MRKVYTPPQLPSRNPAPVLGALGLTLAMFLVLPFTQLFSHVQREILQLRQIEVVLPPPPPPPKQPPPEEKKPEDKPELKEKPKPLTLSQLELVLNPGTGGALQGDFGFGGFETMGPNVVEEMKIFELSEVDKEPELIYQPQPMYPARPYRERIGGTTVVLLVVDSDGSVMRANVSRSSGNSELDDAAVKSVLQYKFTPGVKDGQPVRVKREVSVTFRR
jgi:protein TonB